jgi:hypothetical protein
MTHDECTALWDASTQALAAIRTALTVVQKGPAKADAWTYANLAQGNAVIAMLNEWRKVLQQTPGDASDV